MGSLLAIDVLWLLLMLLVLAAILRHATILENRIQLLGLTALDGPDVGNILPAVGDLVLPRDGFFVFLSATCPPCVKLASALDDPHFDRDMLRSMHVVLVGEDSVGGQGGSLPLPSDVVVHRGIAAEAIRTAYGVRWEPLVLRVEGRMLVAKGHIDSAEGLARLVYGSRPTFEAGGVR